MKKIGKNLADKSRLLSKFLMVLFFILLLGCSDQDSDLTKGFSSNQKSDTLPLGLLENTYRNQRFLFKVSNLPTDGWSTFIMETEYGKKFIDDFHGEKDVDEHDSYHVLVSVPLTINEYPDLEKIEGEANRSGFFLIDIEVISDAESQFIQSAEDLAQMYKIQRNDAGLPIKSEKSVRSADGFLGYSIYGQLIEDNNIAEYGYAFFTRPSGISKRIYRFTYFESYSSAGVGKYKVKFDQIIQSLEFNVL